MPFSFKKYPLAWANIVFILIGYLIFYGISVAMSRSIEVVDLVNIWPVHLVLLFNIAIVSGVIRLGKRP